jgi:uncharacterized Fe-S cluster protein YjdI
MTRKQYRSERVVVSFDPERCIHARYCVRGLPEVFDPSERPWIRPAYAHPTRVAEVVMRCPTGALQFERRDDGAAECPSLSFPQTSYQANATKWRSSSGEL